MLYTRKGDSGSSGLFSTKERFPKDSAVFEALGALDECNSLLGLCRARAQLMLGSFDIAESILKVQESLFIIQGEIAGAEKVITASLLLKLEQNIDEVETLIIKPQSFVIPGATEFSALLDFARTVARLAERRIVTVTKTRDVSDVSLAYLNRTSSLLYALARYSAVLKEQKEQAPAY